ncbi:MAG: hypothetical protein AAF663_05830 [Planctomycetota bacterium]
MKYVRQTWALSGLVLLAAFVVLPGCRSYDTVTNPSFDVTVADAEQALVEMAQSPEPAERPILIVGGYFDVLGTQIDPMRAELEANFGEDAVLRRVHFVFNDFDRLRDKLIELVDQRFGPGDDPDATVAVDAVAMSMGGLVCRYAAMPVDGKRTLNLRWLYTVGTPHRGAAWGTRWSLDALVRDMRIGSPFIRRLAEQEANATYDLVSYVRLGDRIVGEANAAPEGQAMYWLSPLPNTRPHAHALKDPRIMADILRRLRGEHPLASDPPTPLPD